MPMFVRFPKICARTAQSFLQTDLGQRLIALRAKRIDDLESLRRRLGRPTTILCLGNGPSSEDPKLLEIDYDCLFRVKWRWLSRGFLADPHMIFGVSRISGSFMADYPKLSGGIFGFWRVAKELVFLRRQIFRPRLRPFEYFSLARVPSFLNTNTWAARPTNGAVMVATAVALQPKRLVVAGIDLYLHPEGRYPSDKRIGTGYGRIHDRDVELRILDFAFREFRGELLVLSDVLKDALADYQDRQAKLLGQSSAIEGST